ncbi:MAG TPA: hypothetical protein VNB24_02965 [Acidimicrobiales bacterium]|nr:hypothetical protein [Acidimicrobiales bacterium]
MSVAILIGGMVFPGVVALLDCYNRSPEEFAGGGPDRAAWLRWLGVAILTSPIGVGYGILLGYHWNVVRRSTTLVPGTGSDDWSKRERE